MFRMYGRTVQVLKYQISYTENEEQYTDYAASEEEANEIANRVNGTVTTLELENDAWMDGIEVADVPDTYAEAQKVYSAGEQAYLDSKSMPTDSQRLDALESAMLSMMTLGV